MSLEKIVALIIIPIALIGFFVFLTMSGPKKIDYSSQESYSGVLEIPEEVDALRLKYPKMNFQYAWPYDLDIFANLLSEHIINFSKNSLV